MRTAESAMKTLFTDLGPIAGCGPEPKPPIPSRQGRTHSGLDHRALPKAWPGKNDPWLQGSGGSMVPARSSRDGLGGGLRADSLGPCQDILRSKLELGKMPSDEQI